MSEEFEDESTRRIPSPSMEDDETIPYGTAARLDPSRHPAAIDEDRPTILSEISPLSAQEAAALPDLDGAPTGSGGEATVQTVVPSSERTTLSPSSPATAPPPPAAPAPKAAQPAAGSQPPALAPGSVIADRYRIRSTLGVGGMGVVYKAQDLALNLDVALKVLRPEVAQDGEFLERFRNELKVARQVTHRNVVRIHDIGLDQGVYYMSMDFIEGTSLEALLKEKGKLPPEEAIPLVLQMARALSEAHRQSVVHRDLKPANILIDQEGDAYISDFGIARSLDAPGLTQTGVVIGTPHYLSPEQARGEKVDGRSDIYTLGIIFVEMLSGKLPFPGGTLLEILTQRISGEATSLKDLGVETAPEIVAVIDRCLVKDPNRRYQNPDELIAELENLSLARRRKQREKWGQGGKIAAGLTGFAVLVILGWQAVQSFLPTAAGVPTAVVGTEAEAGPQAPRHAIAVLPFDLEGDEALAWTSTGIAEMLAGSLEEDESLRVIDSVRIVQVMKDLGLSGRLHDDELTQLAEIFEADRLVDGQIRTVGDQVRIEARLLEADGSTVVSSLQPREGSTNELFSLVSGLDAGLREVLDSPVSEISEEMMGTGSAEAMQAYTQGLELISQGQSEEAAQRFSTAVEEDENFGAPWVRLAQAYEELGRDADALRAARQAVRVTEGESSRTAWEARAREALLRGEPEKAKGFLQTLVERYPNDIEAQLQLAEALDLLGEWEAADQRLQTIVALDPSEARAWFLLGKSAILSGQVETAVDEYLLRALVQHKKMKNGRGEADVYNALGLGHRGLGELEQSIENFTLAITINQRIEDQSNLAKNYLNRALAQLDAGAFDAAQSDLEAAEKIHGALDDRAGLARLATTRGMLEEERGSNRAALNAYRNALQLSQDLGDERYIAEAQLNVGFTYYQLGEIDSALLHQEKAREIFEQIDFPSGLATALQSIGFSQTDKGQWNDASQSFLKALELARQTENQFAEAISHANLGKVAAAQGRFNAAFQSFDEASAQMEKLGDPRGLAEFRLLRGRALQRLGDFSAAEAELAEAEKLVESSGHTTQRAALAEANGRGALAAGNFSAASKSFAEAARLAGDNAAERLRADFGVSETALRRAGSDASKASVAVGSLRKLLAETQRLGYGALELRVREVLAEGLLTAGDPEAAEEQLNEALRIAERGGKSVRTFRLHHLLAQALEARGAERDAAIEAADARAELDRLKEGLTPEQLGYFEQLPEVRELL